VRFGDAAAAFCTARCTLDVKVLIEKLGEAKFEVEELSEKVLRRKLVDLPTKLQDELIGKYLSRHDEADD